jgi:hypothetical protein
VGKTLKKPPGKPKRQGQGFLGFWSPPQNEKAPPRGKTEGFKRRPPPPPVSPANRFVPLRIFFIFFSAPPETVGGFWGRPPPRFSPPLPPPPPPPPPPPSEKHPAEQTPPGAPVGANSVTSPHPPQPPPLPRNPFSPPGPRRFLMVAKNVVFFFHRKPLAPPPPRPRGKISRNKIFSWPPGPLPPPAPPPYTTPAGPHRPPLAAVEKSPLPESGAAPWPTPKKLKTGGGRASICNGTPGSPPGRFPPPRPRGGRPGF